MALKGAVPDHEGADLPDRWSLRDEHLDGRRALADRPAARSRRARSLAPCRRAPLDALGGVAGRRRARRGSPRRARRRASRASARCRSGGPAGRRPRGRARRRAGCRRACAIALQQRGEPAGPVGDDREDAQAAPDRGLVAARERARAGRRRRCRRRARRPSRPRGAGSPARASQRRDADRARALDDELRALHQQHHRLGGVLLADDDDVVDPALRRAAASARPGRLTAMPSAIVEPGLTASGAPAASAAGNGAQAATWTPITATCGPRELERAGDARDQAAAADRDDHLREIGDLLEQLERRASPGRRSRAGRRTGARTRRRSRAARSRAAATQSSTLVAAERDDAAVGLDRRDLRDRRLGRHEDLAGDAARAAPRRRAPARGCRRCRRRRRVAPSMRGDAVERAAQLERAGALEVLGLQQDARRRSAR